MLAVEQKFIHYFIDINCYCLIMALLWKFNMFDGVREDVVVHDVHNEMETTNMLERATKVQ